MNPVLAFILALVPIIWLVIALCVLKWPSSLSCLSSLGICFILALIFFNMTLINALSAMLEGAHWAFLGAGAVWTAAVVAGFFLRRPPEDEDADDSPAAFAH